MAVKLTHSISLKVLAILLCLMFFLMTAFGVVSFFLDKKSIYSALDVETVSLGNRLSFTLTEPLFYLDKDSIEKLVVFELSARAAVSIMVKDDTNEPIVGKIKNGKWEIVDWDEKIALLQQKYFYKTDKRTIRRTDEYTKEPVVIGYVEITTSDYFAAESLSFSVIKIVIQLILLTLALVCAIFFGLRKVVITKIRKIFAFVQVLSTGDLTATNRITGRDEIGDLAVSLDRFTANVHDIIAGIKSLYVENKKMSASLASSFAENSNTFIGIASSIAEIRDQSGTLDSKIRDSHHTVTDIKAKIDMLNRTISDQASVITTSTGNIGGIIQSLTALSETTKGSRGHIATLKGQAEKGQADIEAAIGSMSVIRESTGIIAGMIVMINDVAERTDLLAMNASIEAAHAGAAGKGFEVIAGEIRNLAVQTKNNARHISESLNLLKARMDDTERNTVETYGTIRSFIGGVFGLSESLNGFIETLATITQGNRRVTESLGNLDKVSLDINGVLASITGSLSEIARRMEEIDTLSSVTKVSVTEISKGIEDISNSMSGLTILGSKNSQVVSALEKELIRFKTRT